MRKAKHAEHENHERWLVSYADFITLLFAFFVVMFASSQADKSKAKQLSEAVSEALERGAVTRKVAEILGGAADDAGKGNAALRGPGGVKDQGAQKPALAESVQTLKIELAEEIKAGKVHISLEARGLVISLREAAFFGSGEDALLRGALPMLEKIAAVVGKLPNAVRLEGHTDAIPIKNGRFRSNWELSSARGIAVLDWLAQKHNIPYNRMAVVAYADTAPKSTNDTEEGRALNRRVDITILTEEGAAKEPAHASAPGKQPAPGKTSRT